MKNKKASGRNRKRHYETSMEFRRNERKKAKGHVVKYGKSIHAQGEARKQGD